MPDQLQRRKECEHPQRREQGLDGSSRLNQDGGRLLRQAPAEGQLSGEVGIGGHLNGGVSTGAHGGAVQRYPAGRKETPAAGKNLSAPAVRVLRLPVSPGAGLLARASTINGVVASSWL